MFWKHLALIHSEFVEFDSVWQYEVVLIGTLRLSCSSQGAMTYYVFPSISYKKRLARKWSWHRFRQGCSMCAWGHLGTVGTVQCGQELQSRVQRLEAKTMLENGEGIGNGRKYPRDISSRSIQISEWLPLGVGDIVCQALSLPGSWAVVFAFTGRIRNAKQKDNRKLWWIFRCAFQAKTEDAQ